MTTRDQIRRQQRMGYRIRQAREANRLTQTDLALRVTLLLDRGGHLDQSMISRYEHGQSIPEPPKRRALEQTLGLQRGELRRLLEPESVLDAPTGLDDLEAAVEELHMAVQRLEHALILKGVL